MHHLTASILVSVAILAPGTFSRDDHPEDLGTISPLFLTPLIKQHKYPEAIAAARVSLLDIPSYSGLLTVDEALNNNIFFWYFPSQGKNPEFSSTIICLGSGPGSPSVYSLFLGSGPFMIENGNLRRRQNSLSNQHNVVYIDNPVGTGYSNAVKEDNATMNTQLTDDLVNSIAQIAELFPEIKSTELFISGESFGAQRAVSVADILSRQDYKLTGVILGSGWVDPISQVEYGNFLQGISLIDDIDFKSFDDLESRIMKAIKGSRYDDATQLYEQLIFNLYDSQNATLFENATGLDGFFSVFGKTADSSSVVNDFLQSKTMREALHVGDLPFNSGLWTNYFLKKDVMHSVQPLIENMLINGIKFLMFHGQQDVICAHQLIEKMVSTLNSGNSFGIAPRKLWYIDGKLAGYWLDYYDLTVVLLRHAGHFAARDQQEWFVNMVNKFTGLKPAKIRQNISMK